MKSGIARYLAIALPLVLLFTMIPVVPAQAQADPDSMAFHRTWERTDKPVADGVVSRTWMWGPDGAGHYQEQYAEAPGGSRSVTYSHKSRMEINHNPGVSPDSVWYVTNGLLVLELVSGQMQVGDASFVPREPARENVAGDFDDPRGVTYEMMGWLLDEAPLNEGSLINWVLTPGSAGNIYMWNESLNAYGVTAARYVPETQHTVASPFWEFMNSSGIVYENGQFVHAPLFLNPFYATGFPITEAYWADVKVGGTYMDVLIQCFERRCLTYTPSNDPAWRVEAGNVGLHYLAWRYGDSGHQPAPPQEPTTFAPWIYGLTSGHVLAHVDLIAANRGDNCTWDYGSGDILITIWCTGSTPQIIYDWQVQVWGSDHATIDWVQAFVTIYRGDNSYMDALAAEVLGDIAAIQYDDAQPEYIRDAVRGFPASSGQIQVGSATFVLNDPFWGSYPNSRYLDIWATGVLD